MPLTLEQALDTSDALAERLAYARDERLRDALEQKKAMVDFAAFGIFKQANIASTLGNFERPLAWGLGLGVPAYAVGRGLISHAHNEANDVVDHARNQALLLGGLDSAGGMAKQLAKSYFSGSNDGGGYKLSADQDVRKLAAYVLLDNVIEAQLAVAPASEKRAMTECLFINRAQGTDLLRRLRR